MASTTLMTVSNLAKSYGPDQIFHNVSFQLSDRDHVALVGVNGAGKSTLLHVIAGAEPASEGDISVASGARIATLNQEPRFESHRTVREEAKLAFDEALAAMSHMRELEVAMQSASGEELDALFQEYERLSLHFEVSGGYEVEHRTDEVLFGLGFTSAQLNEPVSTLSGGQKTRVALAKALLSEPDLLLLDEPTNHLDLAMIEWLEGFLRTWRGAFLVVSHDRYFLDRVTNRTLDLSFGRLEDYPAAYAKYLELRQQRFERRRQEYEDQQELIARTEEFIRRYKAGQRSREARGRQTRLDRLERIERPQEHDTLKLRATPAVRSGRDVLTTSPLRVGYGERTLVSTPELRIERGEKVAIIGANGSGKSTLLKTLVGEISPLKGRVSFGTNVKLGYYAQGHEGLPSTGSPLSILLDVQPMADESARNYLARFLFSGDDVLRSVDVLSGGERSRLALACLVVEGANLLVLDEPTNHLDIHSRETLEEMLSTYDGSAIFVSHDRFFVDRVATRVWEIENGTLTQYLGNYTDAMRQKARRGTEEPAPAKVTSAPNAEQKAIARGSGADSDARRQRRLASVEQSISRLEGRLNELSDAIAISSIDADRDALAQLGTEYATVEAELDAAYAQWESLNTSLAAAAAPG